MVSVIGKEMVPYNASLHNDNLSSQSSSSSIVIESSPPTEEDSNAVARLSGSNNSSDSDFSPACTAIVNKPRKLALIPSPQDVLASIEDIDEIDSACVNEILADHKSYPPQFTLGDPEDISLQHKRNYYFLKTLELKIKKYRKFNNCSIPHSLKNIPLALSYETFIKLYWPGAMSCCRKLFNTSQKYSGHYYKFHRPDTQRPSSSNDNQSSLVRKSKTLSPTSRPIPLSHKQGKLNHTLAYVDSSMDSGDEKSTNRARKRSNSHDAFEKKNEEQMDELERDQMKYEPQHEPGAPENFVATAERLKYFSEVLALKFSKYGHLNTPLQTPTSTHIPLALSLTGFMQYYWPGKISCCGQVRDNCQSLEKHISRHHRPPKPAHNMTIVMSQVDKNIFDKEATDDTDTHQTKITSFLHPKGSKSETSDISTSKSPPGFQADQHKSTTRTIF